jgi:hypothetical protein
MKKLILSLIVFSSYFCFGQTEPVITVPITSSGLSGTIEQGLLKLPSDYATSGGKQYPLLVFFHGAGEAADGGTAGTGLAKIYNSSSAGGPAYYIEHGLWPASFTNPQTGVQEQFIVVTPQAADWNISGDQAAFIINYLVTTYRVDVNRIHLTGLSAGGATIVDYAAQMDANEDAPSLGTNVRTYKPATIVPMSPATNAVQQSWGNVVEADSIRAWTFGDQNNDPFGNTAQDLGTDINVAASGFARSCINPPFTYGHGGWMNFYVPSFRQSFTWRGVTSNMSIYEWMLLNVRSGATSTNPTCSAGSNQSITQPTSTATLSGTAAAASTHTVTGYVWSQTSGPASTITSPTNGTTGGATGTTTTGLTGLTTVGTYTYLLTITQSGGLTATSTVTVTVNANTPVANAGGDQTISLPTTSVSLNGTSSTGTITSYNWSQLSGPNTATLTGGTTSIATASGLIQGSYVFKLLLNGGSSATANVTVTPTPTGCGGTRKYLTPDAGDSSAYITYGTTPSSLSFRPGDTIAIRSNQAFSTIEIHGLTGTHACPIVVTNEGGQAWVRGYMKFYGAKHVHIDGSGFPGLRYGFKIEYHPNEISGAFQNGVGLQITELSKDVEVNNVFIHNTIFGMPIKQSPACADSLNYPNWVMDSISIHDNLIRNTNLEGMYIGDTAPDNFPGYSDPRYVIGCHLPATLDTIYPRPIRSGHMHIYNNIIDTTGRGGIQLSGHSVSVAEINNNTVLHSGMNGDEQQGTGISIGMYTKAWIHDNTITDNLTWGIASLGGSGTNFPLRIENNTIDSCGYLFHYSNVAELIFPVPDGWTVYGPGSGTPAGNNYDFAVPIFIKTATNMDGDSTQFWVKGNRFGKWRAENIKTFPSDSSGLQVFDYASPVRFQKSGNIICGNTRLSNGGPVSFFVDNSITSIPYSTICAIIGNLCNCKPIPRGTFLKAQ